ncbi:Com family DNA-binding transcriptional regulator [Maridesulfovibrio sp.]|nr:Com family DNA-binding transcriptional regulator [Maridesulfovibrio sp.]
MTELRCPVCKRLLMKGRVVEVQIKCPKCKKIVTLTGGK